MALCYCIGPFQKYHNTLLALQKFAPALFPLSLETYNGPKIEKIKAILMQTFAGKTKSRSGPLDNPPLKGPKPSTSLPEKKRVPGNVVA